MKHTLLTFVFFAVSFSIFGQIPAGYYDSAQGLTGAQLKAALNDIIDGHHEFSYSQVWDQLKYTDEDPNNSNNVLLLYTGWSYPKSDNGGGVSEWNREHTWAKSHGNFGTARGPGTDIHHLRPTDVTVNSARGNLFFDNGGSEYIDPSCYTQSGNVPTGCHRVVGSSWEPRDEVKGDVARMIFYMATRYEGENGEVDLELVDYVPANSSLPLHGISSTLLQWHQDDPVSAWEQRRNNRVYQRQGNRNPFIDHPEYADRIWGSQAINEYSNTVLAHVYPNPTTTGQIHIRYNFKTSHARLHLYNVTGQEIDISPVFSDDVTIINNLPKGIFVLRIIDDKVAISKRIVVQ